MIRQTERSRPPSRCCSHALPENENKMHHKKALALNFRYIVFKHFARERFFLFCCIVCIQTDRRKKTIYPCQWHYHWYSFRSLTPRNFVSIIHMHVERVHYMYADNGVSRCKITKFILIFRPSSSDVCHDFRLKRNIPSQHFRLQKDILNDPFQ